MKQFLLFAACSFLLSISSQAQSNTMNFDNQSGYTVYISGQYATTLCGFTNSFTHVVPPGLSSLTVGAVGGGASDEFNILRVYSYDPSMSGACNPNPINSINLSPCASFGLPLSDNIDIYDTCPTPTVQNVTVTWDNLNTPTSVDITIM